MLFATLDEMLQQASWTKIGQDAVKRPSPAYTLSGRLYMSRSGWILLSVPNDLVRGVFSAMDEPGIELPPQDSYADKMKLNAHISVMRPEELEEIGGAEKVSERGKTFKYTLGRLVSTNPSGWAHMSKVWFLNVHSPELQELRKSYGMTPRPNENKFDFHITVAVRRKGVLGRNEKSKAAADGVQIKTAAEIKQGAHTFIPTAALITESGRIDPKYLQLPKSAADEAQEAVRQMLADLRDRANAAGYQYFAVANDPKHPGAGAEVSGVEDDPDSVIRKHIALHRDWANEQGLGGVTWGKPAAEKATKEETEYEAVAKDHAHQCKLCEYFVDREDPHINECTKVYGDIDATGWCNLWEAIRKNADDKQEDDEEEHDEVPNIPPNPTDDTEDLDAGTPAERFVSVVAATDEGTDEEDVETEEASSDHAQREDSKDDVGGVPGLVETTAPSGANPDEAFVTVLADDQLPGGLADDKEPEDFDKKQLGKGTKVELEHVDDKPLAQEIAMDHLVEHDDYYDRLEKVEKEGKVYPFRPLNADPDFIEANQKWHDAEKARLAEDTEPGQQIKQAINGIMFTQQTCMVGPSKIHGRGVYSKQEYQTGDIIDKALILLPVEYSKSPHEREYIRTTVGRFTNHAGKGQANTKLIQNGDDWDLAATRDIAPGEEITADYTEANDDLYYADPRPYDFNYEGFVSDEGYEDETEAYHSKESNDQESSQIYTKEGDLDLNIILAAQDTDKRAEVGHAKMQLFVATFSKGDPADSDTRKRQDNSAPTPPTVAVDFDGTLSEYNGWRGIGVYGDPREGAIQMMKDFRNKGYKIVIHTCRDEDDDVAKWLDEHDIPYDHINNNPNNPPGTSHKPTADAYVDDKAVPADDLSEAAKRVHELMKKRAFTGSLDSFMGRAQRATPITYQPDKGALQNILGYFNDVTGKAKQMSQHRENAIDYAHSGDLNYQTRKFLSALQGKPFHRHEHPLDRFLLQNEDVTGLLNMVKSQAGV